METTSLQETKYRGYLDDTCIITGDCSICLFILKNKEIKSVKIPFPELSNKIAEYADFIKISQNMIINRNHFVEIYETKSRLILMEPENILKVSRKNWNRFNAGIKQEL